MKIILELYGNKENSKVEININQNHRKFCDSRGKICPNSKRGVMPSFAVFSHKIIESDSNEADFKEEFHCYCCADDILLGLETSRSGVIVKNPEGLVKSRQGLNSLI
jgi:hypothetical protein